MRVLAAALVLTALPSPAHAAPCGEGSDFGAEKPPSLTDYIEQHLEVKPLSTEGKLETTRLTEAHENWSEDFRTHIAVCEAQEEAETVSANPVVPSSSLVVAPEPLGVSGSVEDAICAAFGSYCSQAISVASCESTLNVYAVNGQYLGLFQMGTTERATYGHGSDAATQSRAAFAYFAASGYDWSPWACKP